MNIRKHKKMLLSAVCMVLILSLSACTAQQPLVSDETATTTTETEQSTTTEQTVATTTEAEMAVKTTQKTTVRKTTVKKVVTTTEKVKMSPLEAIPVAGAGAAGGRDMYSYPFWSLDRLNIPFEDATAKKTMKVSFNGRQYVGQYVESKISRYINYQMDTYDFELGSFKLNAQTGELVRIDFDGEGKGGMSKAQCQKIVFEIIDKYINRKEYTMNTQDFDDSYCFTFEKYLEGIPTSEKIAIRVFTDGKISYFLHRMGNQFPVNTSAYSALNQQKIRALNTDKAQALALAKAKELFPRFDKRVFKNKLWVMLENGELGMVFVFDLSYEKNSPLEEEIYGSALLNILVK